MKMSDFEVRDILSVLSVLGVEKRFGEVPGVANVTVNYATGSATVCYDETRLESADIKLAVRQSGYEDDDAPAAAPAGDDHEGRRARARRLQPPHPLRHPSPVAPATIHKSWYSVPSRPKLPRLQGDGRTVVHVSQAARVIGLIAIADAIRPTSKAVVAKLRERKIEVVMLTGDNLATAKRVAADLGIDSVLADVLSGQKAEKVKALQATGKKVGMVGDGINDAPELTQEVATLSMSGSTLILAINALMLKRTKLADIKSARSPNARQSMRRFHRKPRHEHERDNKTVTKGTL